MQKSKTMIIVCIFLLCLSACAQKGAEGIPQTSPTTQTEAPVGYHIPITG